MKYYGKPQHINSTATRSKNGTVSCVKKTGQSPAVISS